MKKRVMGFLLVCLLAFSLAGCGADKPEVVVDQFLSAVKEGDYEKAGDYDILYREKDDTILP